MCRPVLGTCNWKELDISGNPAILLQLLRFRFHIGSITEVSRWADDGSVPEPELAASKESATKRDHQPLIVFAAQAQSPIRCFTLLVGLPPRLGNSESGASRREAHRLKFGPCN